MYTRTLQPCRAKKKKKIKNCVWETPKRAELYKFTVNLTLLGLPCENCPVHTERHAAFWHKGVDTDQLFLPAEPCLCEHGGSFIGTGPQQDADQSSNTLKLISVHNPFFQTYPQGWVLLFLWGIARGIMWLTGVVTDLDILLPEVPCFRYGIPACGAGASWHSPVVHCLLVRATIFVKINLREAQVCT